MSRIIEWFKNIEQAWDGFWFTPRDGRTLGLIRLLTGAIVLYMLITWTSLLEVFLGSDGLLPNDYATQFYDSTFAWSHLNWFDSSGALYTIHVIGIVIVGLFTCGFWTRVTGPITALLVISYSNRATGATFGLDQIAGFLTLYLSFSDCGQSFSLAKRLGLGAKQGRASVRNNIAIRLIQIHLCIVYMFAGLGKCQGETWWNGEAIWGAMASYEYQTLDMTWMAEAMWLVSLITMVVMFFETFYVALIWPKLTRPVMLLLAIPMHLGIGVCMGMMEFGLIMLIANLAFVEFGKTERSPAIE